MWGSSEVRRVKWVKKRRGEDEVIGSAARGEEGRDNLEQRDERGERQRCRGKRPLVLDPLCDPLAKRLVRCPHGLDDELVVHAFASYGDEGCQGPLGEPGVYDASLVLGGGAREGAVLPGAGERALGGRGGGVRERGSAAGAFASKSAAP